MAQNLKLLGFASASATSGGGGAAVAAGTVTAGLGGSAATAQQTEVYPNMFDRPNEKVLFRVLHFLLLKLKSQAAQEFRFCWPITTPQDKTSFKKLVQSILHELEKQNHLPIGSSQASRINTGCGPRVVDLVWRLSILVIKSSLERDSSANKLTALPKLDTISTSDALIAIKAKIAMKTHSLKEKSIERSHVQDEWVAFASILTQKIQQIAILQQQVYEEQNRLDTTVNRELYSHVGESQRSTKIQNLEVAWTCIDDVLKSPTYARIQSILNTVVQYNDEQPVLTAESLRSNQGAIGRRGNVDLSEVVKGTEALIRMVRDRVQLGGVNEVGESQNSPVLESSNRHVTMLQAMVLRLQQVLSQVKDANALQARDQYIHMAATASADDIKSGSTQVGAADRQVKLYPLTPAQLLEQENHLVQSLKKVSMKELTALAAESVRKSNQKKEKELMSSGDAEFQPSEGSAGENGIIRKLNYGDGDEEMEP